MGLFVVISANSRAKSLESSPVVIIKKDNDMEQIKFTQIDRGYVEITLGIVGAYKK